MRPSNVPKIIYLLSDGRTHDYPKHVEIADLIRQRIRNVDIYAYGTGEYVAISELLAITKVIVSFFFHRTKILNFPDNCNLFFFALLSDKCE